MILIIKGPTFQNTVLLDHTYVTQLGDKVICTIDATSSQQNKLLVFAAKDGDQQSKPIKSSSYSIEIDTALLNSSIEYYCCLEIDSSARRTEDNCATLALSQCKLADLTTTAKFIGLFEMGLLLSFFVILIVKLTRRFKARQQHKQNESTQEQLGLYIISTNKNNIENGIEFSRNDFPSLPTYEECLYFNDQEMKY